MKSRGCSTLQISFLVILSSRTVRRDPIAYHSADSPTIVQFSVHLLQRQMRAIPTCLSTSPSDRPTRVLGPTTARLSRVMPAASQFANDISPRARALAFACLQGGRRATDIRTRLSVRSHTSPARHTFVCNPEAAGGSRLTGGSGFPLARQKPNRDRNNIYRYFHAAQCTVGGLMAVSLGGAWLPLRTLVALSILYRSSWSAPCPFSRLDEHHFEQSLSEKHPQPNGGISDWDVPRRQPRLLQLLLWLLLRIAR